MPVRSVWASSVDRRHRPARRAAWWATTFLTWWRANGVHTARDRITGDVFFVYCNWRCRRRTLPIEYRWLHAIHSATWRWKVVRSEKAFLGRSGHLATRRGSARRNPGRTVSLIGITEDVGCLALDDTTRWSCDRMGGWSHSKNVTILAARRLQDPAEGQILSVADAHLRWSCRTCTNFKHSKKLNLACPLCPLSSLPDHASAGVVSQWH